MQLWIIPLIAIALLTTIGYFRGRKKNAWISGWIAKETEEALRPLDTSYTNFGGTIGYNFVYKMEKPYREAKGTFTLLPRQSLLYLPVSFLIAKHDRYYLYLFIQGKLRGEGHIVSDKYYKKAQQQISGLGDMERDETYKQNRKYYLYWQGRGMGELLRRFLDKLNHEELLLHFCCYAENKNFFFYLRPEREKLGGLLKSAFPELKSFFLKGADSNDGRNEAEN